MTAIAADRMKATIASDHPSTRMFGRHLAFDRLQRMLLPGRERAKDQQRYARGDVGLDYLSGETPEIHIIVVVVSPTTLPAPPALEAATIAAR